MINPSLYISCISGFLHRLTIGTGVGSIGKYGSCLSIGVASTFFSFAFSDFISFDLGSAIPISSSETTFSLSLLSSLDWDSVLGGDVWWFFFLGPLGGVSFFLFSVFCLLALPAPSIDI